MTDEIIMGPSLIDEVKHVRTIASTHVDPSLMTKEQINN